MVKIHIPLVRRPQGLERDAFRELGLLQAPGSSGIAERYRTTLRYRQHIQSTLDELTQRGIENDKRRDAVLAEARALRTGLAEELALHGPVSQPKLCIST